MAIKLSIPKLPGLSFLKNNDAFAVDIGTSSIKIVYLKPAGNAYTLLKWAVLPLSENLAEIPAQERRNLSVSRIAEFLAREKIVTKNVIGSISGNQTIVRYVRLPKLSREELAKTIRFEAEPFIPFDIREVDLSFHIIGEVMEEGQKKIETILVAAKKEIVQSRLDVFNELNLRPVIMDIDAFALSNAYEANTEPSVAENVMMINIGGSITNIAIIENRIPRVVRDVFVAGNSFSKSIQRALSIDPKTAEEFKARYSILVTVEEKEKTLADNQKEALQVSAALLPVVKELLAEIQKSIDFYVTQNPEKSVNRILLCGGSSNLKNLDKYLQQELKVPVEYFNPLRNFIGAESVPENIRTLLPVAIGLGLRRENDAVKK
jgi:type IV pilus assembly protein PilM